MGPSTWAGLSGCSELQTPPLRSKRTLPHTRPSTLEFVFIVAAPVPFMPSRLGEPMGVTRNRSIFPAN
eukprot:3061044-Prymnesium_polylepis.1